MKHTRIVLFFIFCLTPNVLTLGLSFDDLKAMGEIARPFCMSQTGMTEASLVKINNEKVMINDRSTKCYSKCILEQFGAIKNNSVDVDNIIGKLAANVLVTWRPAIEKCRNIVNPKPCHQPWLFLDCVSKLIPNTFILP